jgi:hypothetical protein
VKGSGVAIRGKICGSCFSYIDLKTWVRAVHPLRSLREIANAAGALMKSCKSKQPPDKGGPSVGGRNERADFQGQ